MKSTKSLTLLSLFSLLMMFFMASIAPLNQAFAYTEKTLTIVSENPEEAGDELVIRKIYEAETNNLLEISIERCYLLDGEKLCDGVGDYDAEKFFESRIYIELESNASMFNLLNVLFSTTMGTFSLSLVRTIGLMLYGIPTKIPGQNKIPGTKNHIFTITGVLLGLTAGYLSYTNTWMFKFINGMNWLLGEEQQQGGLTPDHLLVIYNNVIFQEEGTVSVDSIENFVKTLQSFFI